MTPKQQQNWERSDISPAEFILWFPSHSSTLSWEGQQGLTPLLFLFSYGLHFPAHDTRHGRNPPWWNLPTGWAVKSTLQLGSPSTAAKNNRDNRCGESWDVKPNVPQASFVFSVRGSVCFHAIPALEHSWGCEWLVQSFSSQEFSWLCKPWLTLGMLKFTTFGTESWGWVTVQAEVLVPLKLLGNFFSPSLPAEICHCLPEFSNP